MPPVPLAVLEKECLTVRRELTVKTKVKVYDASENFDIAMTVRKVNLNSRGSETYC